MTFATRTEEERLPAGNFLGPFFSVRFFTGIGELKGALGRNEVGSRGILARTNPDGDVTTFETTFSLDDDEAILADIQSAGGLHRRSSAQELIDSHRLQDFKSELRVEFTGQTARFTLTLTPPRDVGFSLIDKGVIRRRTLTLVEWGYAGQAGGKDVLSGPYLFYSERPEIALGDDVVITVTGTDVMNSPMIRNERPGDSRRYPRSRFRRDIDIVQDLARENKMKIVTDFCFDEGTSPLFREKGTAESPDVVIPRQNDWIFFKRLLRLNRTGFFIKGNEIVLYDQDLCFGRPIQWRLHYYSQPTDSQSLLIQSFNAQVREDYYGIAASKSLECVQDDPDAGVSQATVFNPAIDPAFSFLGRYVGVGNQYDGQTQRSTQGELVYGPELPPDEAAKHVSLPEGALAPDGVARDIVRRAMRKAGLEADSTIIGHPQFIPFDMCQVEGIGIQYSGKYQVMNCTHIIGNNGFDIQAKLFRSSTANVESEDTNVPIGKKVEDRKVDKPVIRPTQVEEPERLETAEQVSRRIIGGGGGA